MASGTELTTMVECAGDKALGSNRFNFSFHVAWDFVKENFRVMLTMFHQRGHLGKKIDATYITLIPWSFKDLGPISLVGCVYKFPSETAANSLRRILSCIVSPLLRAVTKALHSLSRKTKDMGLNDGFLLVGMRWLSLTFADNVVIFRSSSRRWWC